MLQIGVDLRRDLFDVHPGWRVSDSDVRNRSFLFAETSSFRDQTIASAVLGPSANDSTRFRPLFLARYNAVSASCKRLSMVASGEQSDAVAPILNVTEVRPTQMWLWARWKPSGVFRSPGEWWCSGRNLAKPVGILHRRIGPHYRRL